MKEQDQAPRTEQEQKGTSTRSHCNSKVGDDPNEHETETHREKSKIENSAKSDRRRRHRHNHAKLVIMVNTVVAGTDTIGVVRSEAVTLVTVPLTVIHIMMTATLIDISTGDHL